MSDIFESAPCRQTDPELFFPAVNGATQIIATAVSICAVCPLDTKVACARLAVRGNENSGVWAGVNLRRNHGPARTAARAALEEISGEKFPDPNGPRKPRAEAVVRAIIVARMTEKGYTAKEIAVRLEIDERTVDRHRKKAIAC